MRLQPDLAPNSFRLELHHTSAFRPMDIHENRISLLAAGPFSSNCDADLFIYATELVNFH